MAEKKPDFVVSDRRKFTDEGELRTDVREDTPIPSSSSVQPGMGENDKPPEPPSRAEQEAQHKEYRASGKKLDDMLTAGGHGKAEDRRHEKERQQRRADKRRQHAGAGAVADGDHRGSQQKDEKTVLESE